MKYLVACHTIHEGKGVQMIFRKGNVGLSVVSSPYLLTDWEIAVVEFVSADSHRHFRSINVVRTYNDIEDMKTFVEGMETFMETFSPAE